MEENNFIFSVNSNELEKYNVTSDFRKNSKINRKVVLIADWIKEYLTLEHYKFAENLQEFGWEIMELSRVDLNYIKKEKCIVLCVTYDGFDLNNLKHENVTIIFKIDDLYPYKEIRNECINNCDLLISPYKYLFNQEHISSMYSNISNKQSYWIPYSAVNDFYQNIEFNYNPKNKILISGMTSYLYPFRQKLHNISLENEYKDNLETLLHAFYNGRNHDFINENYYKKLNEYICCFTDASSYKYILLKNFEITSVGSLLLADDIISKELNELGFYDNVNCVMSNKDNIYEKIDWILDTKNIDIVNSIRKAGMELTRKNHNTRERAKGFNSIINQLL
jgi:hypothetical protein